MSVWTFLLLTSFHLFACRVVFGKGHRIVEECPDGWHPFAQNCYWHSSVDGANGTRSFDESGARCRAKGSDLVSIHSEEENSFVSSLVPDQVDMKTWIGLSNEGVGSTLKWIDNTDVNYTNFYEQPPLSNSSCGYLLSPDDGREGLWGIRSCHERSFFMCKKSKSSDVESFSRHRGVYPVLARIFTDPKKRDGSEGGSRLKRESTQAADETSRATTTSKSETSTLTTPKASAETLASSTVTSHAATALATSPTTLPMTTTTTATTTPTTTTSTTTTTTTTTTTITARPETPSTTRVPIAIGCYRGDKMYKGSCYSFSTDKLKWQNAKDACKSRGGHLVVINDRYESAFLSSSLTNFGEQVWIGFSGTSVGDHGVIFSWVNNGSATFTNWDEYEPTSTHGSCVFVSGKSNVAGLWKTWDCEASMNYICEYDRKGFSPSTTTTTTTPAPTTAFPIGTCSEGWSWYVSRCYKVFVEPRTWADAEQTCNAYGAFLTSIGHNPEREFLQGLVTSSGISYRYSSLWIGLYLSPAASYRWTDGSIMDYTYWADGQPDTHLGREVCVAVSRTGFYMEDEVCTTYLPFICKAMEGTILTTRAPPTEAPDVPCQDDPSWLLFEDHCYKFVPVSSGGKQTFSMAQRLCRIEGGELASIHTIQENAWIASKIYHLREKYIWIGGRESQERGFQWEDGSAFDFINWQKGEPNDLEDANDCLIMHTKWSGCWNDISCTYRAGRICKKPLQVALAEPAGTCPEGWHYVGSKCFQIFSEEKNHKDARLACTSLGSGFDLISIHSAKEQAYITATLDSLQYPVWIGMRRLMIFYWEDESTVTYTNWAKGEPNGGNDWIFFGENCVEMYTDSRAGSWNDVNCYMMKGYVCEKKTSENIGTHIQLPSCEPPFEDYLSYGGACYKAHSTPKAWEDAESTCAENGAHLASAHVMSDASLLWILALDAGIKDAWIGFNNLENENQFVWNDGWPTFYTHWAKYQPDSCLSDHNCVKINADDEGKWYSEQCSHERPFICKKEFDPVPTPDAPHSGSCPDGRWRDFGGSFCYMFVEEPKTWNDANENCTSENANLLSVHSQEEMNFIVKATYTLSGSFWTGLLDTEEGQSWTDGTGIDYTNWRSKEPNSDEEECVEFYMASGEWNDVSCEGKANFICKAPKERQTEETSHIEKTSISSTSLNAGGVVGIVIAVLFISVGAGVVGAHFLRRKPKSGSTNGFGNALYSERYDGTSSVTVSGINEPGIRLEDPVLGSES